MRDLSKLRIRSKEIIINEVPLKIHGLTFPELAQFAEISEKSGNAEVIKYMLRTALRKAIPQEEMADNDFDIFLNEISGDAATQVINALKELSGLKEPESEKK